MVIASISHHWPARKMEWVLGGMVLAWGLYTLSHPEMFYSVSGTGRVFSGLVMLTPSWAEPFRFWGWMASVVGLIRLMALYVNGAHVRTPVVRVVTAFLTMFVFAQIAIGFWQSGVANTGIVIYSGLVVADIISAYAAGQDAITAEVQRRIERGSLNDDDSYLSRSLAKP